MRSILAVVLAAFLTAAAPATALASAPPNTPTGAQAVDAVVDGWQRSSVYVELSMYPLVPKEDAERLRKRLEGHRPDIRIAVIPAASLLGIEPAGTREEMAREFVDATVDKRKQDGIYIIVFGGAIAWGSAVGVDAPIGEILPDELAKHTRSEPVAMLDGVLTRLGVPESEPANGIPVRLIVGAGIALAIVVGVIAFWLIRRRKDEGPALYRPSFEVLPDEADSVDERRRLAREDVTRFGEELDAADVNVETDNAAAHVQAAMDAYQDAGRVVDGEPDDAALRNVRATVEYGRWRLAVAQATLAGTPAPPRRVDCFFDPAHGMSTTDWMYTPQGGRAREIPVCAACAARLSGGST
jgi:hypothetical protein